MKKCEKCGMIGRDDMTFCVNCGGNMVDAPADPVAAKASVTPMNNGVANDALDMPAEPVVDMAGTMVNNTVAKPKVKMNKNTVLLIGIIAAVLVGIGGIIFGIAMANSKGRGNSNQTPSAPTTVTITTTEVVVGRWIFTIPDGIDYDNIEDGSSLMFGEDDWMAVTKYDGTATYSKIKNNLQTYAKEIAKQLSMEVYETGTTEVGDSELTWIDFIVPSDDEDEEYCTMIFSEASDMYAFMTLYVDGNLELNHDRFEDIAEVVSSARKGTDSKIVIDEEIKIDILKPIDLSVIEL